MYMKTWVVWGEESTVERRSEFSGDFEEMQFYI